MKNIFKPHRGEFFKIIKRDSFLIPINIIQSYPIYNPNDPKLNDIGMILHVHETKTEVIISAYINGIKNQIVYSDEIEIINK